MASVKDHRQSVTESRWLQDGKTALHYASETGHFEVAEILVQRGADIIAADKVPRRALC